MTQDSGKPQKPSTRYYRLRNKGYSDEQAMHIVLLAYLDEQHAAGQGELRLPPKVGIAEPPSPVAVRADLRQDRTHIDLPGVRVRCEPEECHRRQSEVMRERDEALVQVDALKAKLEQYVDADGIWQSQMEIQLTSANARAEALGQALEAALASRNALVQSGDESYHRAEALEKELGEVKLERDTWREMCMDLGAPAVTEPPAPEPKSTCGVTGCLKEELHFGECRFAEPAPPPVGERAIVVGVQACTECGGSGEGPDQQQGAGDVYQGKCGRCNGTGIKPG